MKVYLELLRRVLDEGGDRPDRTGVGTRSLFGYQLRIDLSKGFPLLTTKRVHFKSVVGELLWMLSGETRVGPLHDLGVTIWDEWATPEQCSKFGREPGDLGPVYGHQWRRFGASETDPGVDQIAEVVRRIREEPHSRRLLVTGWNPKEADRVALPPCHTLFQFYVQDRKLSCQLYQRSGDVFLGVPFNIASYALLTTMIAHVTGLIPGDFVHTFGDVHLYRNHFEQAKLQLSREPRPLPRLNIKREVKDIFAFRPDDFEVTGYDPHPAIKAEVAV